MTQPRDRTAGRFADALGASRVVPIEGISAQGPLGLLWLRAAFARKLRRDAPLDASAVAEWVRTADPQQWIELESLAAELSRSGTALDPLELAAHLIEHGLLDLQRHRGSSHEAGRVVRLDAFYEGLTSPADCFESMEAA
jgi:hypothetical protein